MGRPAAGGNGSGEFSIAFVNGPIKFQSEEGVLYSRFFHIVRGRSFASRLGIRSRRQAAMTNSDALVRAHLALFLFIWRLASGGKSQEKLNKDCWFVAMKLVALVQSTGKCQMQSLYSGETLPLADFQLDQPVDNVLPEEALPEFKRSFVVSVSTPVVVGSGYSSHEKLSQTLELQIVLTASTEVCVGADGVFLSSKNVQQVEIKTDDDYAKAEDRMNQAKEQVQFIANSLKVESKRMDSGKTANFKTALLSLANLELDYQVQVQVL
ncbi:hypothetical protein BBJ28_00002422 [Nothophytophthora sp. Chile5]|nr:hypothetical protein BBJ28_00002422 [Nothophytophthora sp. Chile5]